MYKYLSSCIVSSIVVIPSSALLLHVQYYSSFSDNNGTVLVVRTRTHYFHLLLLMLFRLLDRERVRGDISLKLDYRVLSRNSLLGRWDKKRGLLWSSVQGVKESRLSCNWLIELWFMKKWQRVDWKNHSSLCCYFYSYCILVNYFKWSDLQISLSSSIGISYFVIKRNNICITMSFLLLQWLNCWWTIFTIPISDQRWL